LKRRSKWRWWYCGSF